MKAKFINEEMGGVSAPMSTPYNTPGMGNAIPPSENTLGSGDNWCSSFSNKLYTQSGSIKRKKKKKKGKKHKIKKLETFLSQYYNVINEETNQAELETDIEKIDLDKIEILSFKKLSKEQEIDVLKIVREYSPYLYPLEMMLSGDQKRRLQIFIYNGKVLGYFDPDRDPVRDDWDVKPFKVAKEYQGQGIGTKMLSDFYKDKKGSVFIYDKNIASIKAFLKNGFKAYKQDIDPSDPNDKPGHYYRNYDLNKIDKKFKLINNPEIKI